MRRTLLHSGTGHLNPTPPSATGLSPIADCANPFIHSMHTVWVSLAFPLLLKGEQSDYFLVSQHSSKIDTGSLNKMIKQFTYQYDDKNLKFSMMKIELFCNLFL